MSRLCIKSPDLVLPLRDSKRERDGACRKNAFTLIEILVSIGIIAILLAIALPALSKARQRARDVSGLSNLRQTGILMENYASRYQGSLPYAGRLPTFYISPYVEHGSSVSTGYWDLAVYWSSLFHEVAPWEEWFNVWTYPDPRRPTEHPWEIDPRENTPFSNGITSLRYCRSLFARPEVWDDGGMIENISSALRPVRLSEIRYPSSKVSLYDGELCVRVQCDSPMDAKRAMLFLDGHADQLALSEANEPVRGRVEGMADPAPLHDTPNGARGRDYP